MTGLPEGGGDLPPWWPPRPESQNGSKGSNQVVRASNSRDPIPPHVRAGGQTMKPDVSGLWLVQGKRP